MQSPVEVSENALGASTQKYDSQERAKVLAVRQCTSAFMGCLAVLFLLSKPPVLLLSKLLSLIHDAEAYVNSATIRPRLAESLCKIDSALGGRN